MHESRNHVLNFMRPWPHGSPTSSCSFPRNRACRLGNHGIRRWISLMHLSPRVCATLASNQNAEPIRICRQKHWKWFFRHQGARKRGLEKWRMKIGVLGGLTWQLSGGENRARRGRGRRDHVIFKHTVIYRRVQRVSLSKWEGDAYFRTQNVLLLPCEAFMVSHERITVTYSEKVNTLK